MQGKGSILRRAGPLMAGRLAIALVTFATPLVLARALVQDSYGTFKLAWLWCNTLAQVLPMGLTPSLIYFVPREPQRRQHFIAHALLVTSGLGLCVGVLLYLFGPRLALRIDKPELAAHMAWVAVFSALYLGGSTIDAIALSQGRIKLAAVLRFAYEATQALGIVAGALLTRSIVGTFAGIVLATALRAGACWVMVLRDHGLHVSREDLKRQLSYALPFGLAFAIIIPQQQFHQYFVSASVSAALFAIYSVGCFNLPIVDMLYTPVSDVLQLGIAEHDRDGDRDGPGRLFHEAVARLAFVFIPTMALLYVCGPTLVTFLYTDRYRDSVPIFRLAILSIPLAALPLDGVMRARAQNRFVLAVSVVKLALTVPLVIGGFHAFGLPGAMGAWVAVEAFTRGILLVRTGQLFGSVLHVLPWRALLYQALGAAVAAPVGVLVLRIAHGPALLRLFLCGTAFALAYLAVLRATGQLPPLREWIPRKRSVEQPVSIAA